MTIGKYKKVRAIIKAPGGKAYLCRRIWELLPKSASHFVEPYCRAATVTLSRHIDCDIVTINDIDWQAVSVLKAVRDYPSELQAELNRLPHGRAVFLSAKRRVAYINNFVEAYYAAFDTVGFDLVTTFKGVNLADLCFSVKAAADYIRVNRMSRGGLDKDYGWSDRLRGGQPEYVNAFETTVANIPTVSESLRCVRILSPTDAVFVISQVANDPAAVLYLDPPYLKQTRVSYGMYRHEMTTEDHKDMLSLVTAKSTHARIAISGYQHPLYDKALRSWNRIDIDIVNHMSQKSKKQRKLECIWYNF